MLTLIDGFNIFARREIAERCGLRRIEDRAALAFQLVWEIRCDNGNIARSTDRPVAIGMTYASQAIDGNNFEH